MSCQLLLLGVFAHFADPQMHKHSSILVLQALIPTLVLPSSFKCFEHGGPLWFSVPPDRLRLCNPHSLTEWPEVSLTLAVVQLSYFYMDELFSNSFSNVLGTNMPFFSIRNAGLPFPTIPFPSTDIVIVAVAKKILLLTLHIQVPLNLPQDSDGEESLASHSDLT